MTNTTFHKAIAALAFLLWGGSLLAQVPSGYYDSAEGKTGDALKVALHDIIKGHTIVSYSDLLDAFAYTDCYPNGKIWDIYSNYQYSLNQNGGSFSQEGQGWNREHTWPQSWFNEKAGPKSDLFHIMPTDGYVNNRRGSYPYGEVNNPTYTSGNGSKLGPCVTSGYSGTVFEPIDDYKGDVARNYFYMSVRYYSEDSGWSTSDMTNKSVILDWAMTMLLRWSDEDPVSQKEIDRNNAVYGYQGNRNPFIDHPEYARMIWDENWSGYTYYNITVAACEHGEVCASASSGYAGQTITLTAEPDSGYELESWNVFKTGDSGTTVSVSNNTFTMPAFAITVSATFVESVSISGDYIKVTSAPSDWSGEYLIVYEGGNVAFNGALTTLDATDNTISVTISDNTIASSTAVDAATFTIAPSGSSYSIKSASGYYIGRTSNDNGLQSSQTTVYTNTLTYNNGNIDIVGSGGAYLRFNANSGQNRFRYFKSGTYTNQQAIQLYKKTATTATQSVTLAEGWNWWAPTVETTVESVQTAIGSQLRSIVDESGDTPTSIVLGKMYKIRAWSGCSFTLSGTRPASVTVSLASGANWFGYTGTTTETINAALGNFTPAAGDKIIDQDDGFAIYENGTWEGTLTGLQHGKGYIYVTHAANTLTF